MVVENAEEVDAVLVLIAGPIHPDVCKSSSLNSAWDGDVIAKKMMQRPPIKGGSGENILVPGSENRSLTWWKSQALRGSAQLLK